MANGKNGSTQEVSFGKRRIQFGLEYRNRERLSISVHPDRTVTVLAPRGRSLDEVLSRVQKRAAWIAKQQAYFDQFHPFPPARRFVAGETHYYLGRQYRLKLLKSEENVVKLIGCYLRVYLPDRDDSATVERLMNDWYRDHAATIFARRLDACLDSAQSLNLARPPVTIRKMSKRWGSCTKSGTIILNTDLVKTPLHCIEYVIMHELCHIKIHDHSPRFYRLLTRCMPDWEARKKRLEQFIV